MTYQQSTYPTLYDDDEVESRDNNKITDTNAEDEERQLEAIAIRTIVTGYVN